MQYTKTTFYFNYINWIKWLNKMKTYLCTESKTNMKTKNRKPLVIM